jgi:hypothetical protein
MILSETQLTTTHGCFPDTRTYVSQWIRVKRYGRKKIVFKTVVLTLKIAIQSLSLTPQLMTNCIIIQSLLAEGSGVQKISSRQMDKLLQKTPPLNKVCSGGGGVGVWGEYENRE